MELHSDHRITPAEGSARRADGRPADLLNPLHYPVTAVCLECGRPIHEERYMFSDWEHVYEDDDPGGEGDEP